MSVELRLPEPFELRGANFESTRLSLADLDDIYALEVRSHAYPWTRDNLRSSIESHTCIGLRYGNRWAAHAILSFAAGEAELLLFVIDKDWQGKGLGCQFLQRLVQAAKAKAQTIFLEVRASNDAAVALYEKIGFHQVGVRPGYYPAGSRREDALVHALDLAFWDA